MFPEAHRPNTFSIQEAADFFVAGPVAFDLSLPKARIVLGYMPAPRAAMPEAAVDEDSESGRGEEEIGFAWQVCGLHDPTRHSSPYHSHFEPQLCCLVAIAADSGHVPRPLRRDIEGVTAKLRFQQALHKTPGVTLKARMPKKPQFVSFFAGARGFDLGLEEAGLDCIAANEFDRTACKTIRANAPHLKVYEEDVRLLTADRLKADLGIRSGDLFAIAGGPPCQAFSTAGRRLGLNDERGNVFFHFLKLIDDLRPKYAVFENVRGLLSAPMNHRPHMTRGANFPALQDDEKPGGALKLILALLQRAGYAVTFNLYNTASFGVPQSRERLIFIASREGQHVPHLQPTHSAKGEGGLLPWVTFREAVRELKGIEHHAASFPAKRLEFYKLLKAGQNWRDLPEDVQAQAMGNSFFSGGGKTGFYRRLAWDKPAPTLVTRPNMKATDLCHPKELRPLSVEEYAAIQTFPADYKFIGNLDDQYRQIGNAVPCHFAQQVGQHLLHFDAGKTIKTSEQTSVSRYVRTDETSWVGAIKPQLAPGLFDAMERTGA